MEHRTIIALRIHDEPRVLLGGKEFFFANMSVATYQLPVFASQFDELIDHLVLTWLRPAGDGGEAVMLGIVAEMIETSVTITRPAGRGRVDLVEITQHRLDRCVHAVEVQPVNPGQTSLPTALCIPGTQPFGEFDH